MPIAKWRETTVWNGVLYYARTRGFTLNVTVRNRVIVAEVNQTREGHRWIDAKRRWEQYADFAVALAHAKEWCECQAARLKSKQRAQS